MKHATVIFLVVMWAPTAFGQQYAGASFRTQSYYGFSGLSFIPTAQTQPPEHVTIAYTAKPATGADLTLQPFSVKLSYGARIPGLEFAATNTPFYASKRELGGVAIANGLPELDSPVPIFPSVKYQVMSMTRKTHRVAMAIGLALPYGAYYVVDKFFDATLVDITLHTGVGTKLTTYHAFAGATITFGRRAGEIHRDFPLEMLLEGSWGGSLKHLNEKEEAFFAISFRLAWTSSLFMTTFFRIDSQRLFEDAVMVESGPTRLVGIGLNYTFRR
ncbi:MAG: hypothetical protein ACE5IY_09915 [bacterium]